MKFQSRSAPSYRLLSIYVERVVEEFAAKGKRLEKIEDWNQAAEDRAREMIMADRGQMWVDWLDERGLALIEAPEDYSSFTLGINFVERRDEFGHLVQDGHTRIFHNGIVVHDPNGFDLPHLAAGSSWYWPVQRQFILCGPTVPRSARVQKKNVSRPPRPRC